MKRLPCAVPKAFLVAFRTQPEIDRFHPFHIASFDHNPRKQTVPRRIRFVPAIESGLIPEPASAKLKSIIPRNRALLNFEHAQGDDTSLVKSLGQLFEEHPPLQRRQTARASSGQKACHVGSCESRQRGLNFFRRL